MLMKYKIGDVCKNGHPITEDNLNTTKVGGTRCKVCARATHERFRIKHRERIRLNWNKWKANNPEKIRATVIKHKYGISPDDVTALLKKQDGRCAICGYILRLVQSNEKVSRDSLCIDHDHLTDQVRGLLCNSCNTGLGKFKDSIDNLLSAVKYLRNS